MNVTSAGSLEGFCPRRLSNDEPVRDYAPSSFLCLGAALSTESPPDDVAPPPRLPTIDPRAAAWRPTAVAVPPLEMPGTTAPAAEPPPEPVRPAPIDAMPSPLESTQPSHAQVLHLLGHAMRLLEKPSEELLPIDRVFLGAAENLLGRLADEFRRLERPPQTPPATPRRRR